MRAVSGLGGRHFALAVAALLVLHVVTWTLYGTLALGFSSLHDDMTEAWVWGQEWQLGYFKHPPLFGWVAGTWFHVFPRTDWSFYFLSSLNSAIGLAGVAALAPRFGLRARRLVPVLILMLTPLYGFLSLKFNANAILVSIWPWATYAFLRCLETGSARHGLACGVLCALAMLGKYYSTLLLVTFLAVALLPANRARVFRSPAPYVAIATAALVLAPHLWWTVANGFPTVAYAASKFKYPLPQILAWAGMTALAPLIFFGAVSLLVWLAVRRPSLTRLCQSLLRDERTKPLALIALLPFALTLVFGLFGHAKVSLSYTIPIFFALPILMVIALGRAVDARAVRTLAISAAVFQAGVILAAPAVAYARVVWNVEGARQPNKALARQVTRLWHEQIGTPLRIIAGETGTAPAIAFYSADSPSQFINFRSDHAPWITPQRIAAQGMMIVCFEGHRGCLKTASTYRAFGAREFTRVLRTKFFGRRGAPYRYHVLIVPPSSSMID
jgi:4-amino-4-deoxy-L-arabinose transferase-like glycosyltransferase